MTTEHKIQRLGLKGDGIADGPVYAPRTLPGEVISGAREGDRIDAPRIVTPSPDRVRPPCPHYKSCGGCQLMHASDAFVSNWRMQVVQDALRAHDLEAEVTGISVSPPHSRRRATVTGRRQKSGSVVGFHGRASHTVIDVPECQVMRPELLAARDVCMDLTGLLGTRKGEVRIAVTLSEAGLDLDVSGGRDLNDTDRAGLAALAEHRDVARLSHQGDLIVERRAPVQRFDGIAVVPPPGAFLQATTEGQAALTAAVLEAIGPAKRVADLFAGCGTFSLPTARRARVHAVEGEKALISALETSVRFASGIKPVTTETRDLFRRPLDAEELRGFDAIVIDPPRAGAAAQTAEIAGARVPRIAMVSCNPVSFARDAKMLSEAGYEIDALRIVDQFRWSTHVELVAALRLPDRAR